MTNGKNELRPIAEPIKGITAAELMLKELPPLSYVVKDFLPQGLVVLASPPKYGKSWLVLDLCLSVTGGRPFLGHETEKSSALYLALEDSQNRLQNRIKCVLSDETPPDNLVLSTKAQTIGHGLLDQLEEFIGQNKDTKLIVIDTLQKVRGATKTNEAAYSNDYKELGNLKTFADKHSLCLLLVHHLRKMNDESDVFSRISGTNGISGAADTMIVLSKKKRTDADTTLSITGRDVEQNDFILNFDKTTYKWRIIGSAEEEAERRELEAYKNNPIVQTVKHLLEPTGIWSGTATELHEAIMKYTGKFVSESIRSPTLAKEVRGLQKQLYELDKIVYNPPKYATNNKRIHTFKALNRPTLLAP